MYASCQGTVCLCDVSSNSKVSRDRALRTPLVPTSQHYLRTFLYRWPTGATLGSRLIAEALSKRQSFRVCIGCTAAHEPQHDLLSKAEMEERQECREDLHARADSVQVAANDEELWLQAQYNRSLKIR
jgi:hypothetical protein